MMYPDEDDDYQAKEDLRTLIEARKIKADKDRMKAVRECAEKKKAEMNAVVSGKRGK